MKKLLGGLISGLFQLVLVAIFAVFVLGQCVGDYKWMLSVLSSDDAPSDGPRVRRLDPSRPFDARIVASFAAIARAADVDPKAMRGAVLVSSEVNAAYLGDQYFLFWEGLAAASEIQLDSIMAHEIAHMQLGHVEANRARHEVLGDAVAVLGTIQGADSEGVGEVLSWAGALSMPPFRREQELEADSYAVALLEKAGHGPRAAHLMAETLLWLQGLSVSIGRSFFDSHPTWNDRLEALRRRK